MDIGSGSGGGLRELQKRFRRVTGYDPYSHAEGITNERPLGKFDLITMFHVLEHVEDLREMLQFIKGALNDDGRLLVQVPYAIKWPFDFIIADHLWHFTMQSLKLLLQKNGFEVISINNDIIEKEITCVARAKWTAQEAIEPNYESANMFYAIQWLCDYERSLRRIMMPVAVYGAAPAAAWAASVLESTAEEHIDDNPKLIGTTLNGRPIHPASERSPLPVVAPFFGKQLESVRAKSPHLRFV